MISLIFWITLFIVLGYIINGYLGIIGSLLLFHDSYISKILLYFRYKLLYKKYEMYKLTISLTIIPTLYFFWDLDVSYVIVIFIAYYFVFLADKTMQTHRRE